MSDSHAQTSDAARRAEIEAKFDASMQRIYGWRWAAMQIDENKIVNTQEK